MRYEDFVIQVTAGGPGETVLRVSESPVGQSAALVAGPTSPLGRLLEHNRGSGWGLDDLMSEGGPEQLGQLLFDALFTGPIHRRFLEAVGRSGSQGARGLRIQLQVDFEAPSLVEVHSLPWEFLYRGEVGSFLALDRRFTLVRHLRLPVSRDLPPAPPRLKLLVAVAAPEDRQRLDTEEECRRIAAGWQGRDAMEVDFLAHATLDRLRRRLLAEEYQGLHFIGHGEIEPGSGEGLLLLEDGRWRSAPTAGRDLAIQLADRASLRWVFLNACSTGNSSTHRPFGGLAAALLRTGVPAVVAMQRPLSDRAAVVFSDTVYRRLAEGDGIDTAVSEGRLAIHSHLPGSFEWGTPVLFLRSSDGTLFRRGAAKPPSVPDTGPSRSRRRGLLSILAVVLILFGLVALSKMGLSPPRRPADEAGGSTPVKTNPPAPVEPDPSPPPKSGWKAVTVREGEVVQIPGFGAQVSVSFDGSWGESFVRLTVTLERGGESVGKTFMGPTTVPVGEGRSLRIQTIDWLRREVRILPVGADRDGAGR